MTLNPSRQGVDTFLVNGPLLPWSLRESVRAHGMAHPQVIRSDHLPVRLALRGLLNAAGHGAMPAPYSHTEGSLLPYDAEAAPVQRCLWAAVTAGQGEPSLSHWLGPAEQHAYGSMPTAAVDKVFEHLHAAHDALVRVVGHRQPSPAGGDPPESVKKPPGCNPPLRDPGSVHTGGVPGERGTAWRPVRGSVPVHGGTARCIARIPPGQAGPTTGGAREASSRPRGGHPPPARTPGGRPQARHQRLLALPRPGHRPAMESRARGHRDRGLGPVGPLERAGPTPKRSSQRPTT